MITYFEALLGRLLGEVPYCIDRRWEASDSNGPLIVKED